MASVAWKPPVQTEKTDGRHSYTDASTAMNISFFFLILVLFALAFLTSWNPHVLLLLGVTTLLWGAMMWYVLHIHPERTAC
jgi:archaellum biogenesis protein FlaJ (TadC family)